MRFSHLMELVVLELTYTKLTCPLLQEVNLNTHVTVKCHEWTFYEGVR